MAEITEERLREFASSNLLTLAICATLGEPSWADVRAIAAELLAARAELRRMSEWHDEIADALRAEVERLRADLREATSLLGQAWSDGAGDATWSRETQALLEKHKETP